MSDVLTVDDIIGELRCSRGRVFELLKSGEIPSFRVGRRRLIRRQDFDDFLARKAAPTNTEGLGGR